MINIIGVKKFCCDDISLIENYEKAIQDKEQTWHCHHRFETDKNLNSKELKERNLYFHRPSSELIFLTPSDHLHLHSKHRWNDPNFRKKQIEILTEANKRLEVRQKHSESKKGTHNSDEHNKNISKAKKEFYTNPDERKKLSQLLKGKSKDKRWMSNGVQQIFVKQENTEYYLSKGYHFGRK